MEIKLNRKDNSEERKAQEDPWVMYLIVRQSLNMSAGKTAAQCGHAVDMLSQYFNDLWAPLPVKSDNEFNKNAKMRLDYSSWRSESFRKVVLKAKDNKWEKLKEKLPCVVVRDAGLTEVEPGSETVLGIWPIKKSQRPNILRKLQALK